VKVQEKPKINIVLSDENSFFVNVKDAVLIEFLKYLKKYSKFFSKKWNGNFDSIDAMNKFVKESIIGFLNEEFVDYSARVSEFRKKGYNLEEVSLKLMKVPLKIKLVNVEWKINDLNKVFVLFYFAKKVLDNCEALEKKKEEERKAKEIQEEALKKKAEANKKAFEQKDIITNSSQGVTKKQIVKQVVSPNAVVGESVVKKAIVKEIPTQESQK
ncbi:MAG: hypothetical protein OQK82_03075, partial [Candidatus Pacearchaeota archaeon]|nr:hypothetical protein [Candidatus Pacearchaeota archaeon]